MTCRASFSAAMVVATGAFLAGCAATPEPLPAPRGEPMGDGMYRLVDRGEVRRLEAAHEPWSPSPFYPGISDEIAASTPVRDELVSRAETARSARPTAARSSSAGAAWVFFQAYSNTWSRADGSTCRFAPTCSGFGREAIADHGLLGVVMTFGRLHRNHSDTDFYAAKGPRLLDPVRLYDFWFRPPGDDDREEYRSIDAYLRLEESRKYDLPAPPEAP